MGETTVTENGIQARYVETDDERQLIFEQADDSAVRAMVAQNLDGYAMLAVRMDGEELERYYGLDMALDHVAELLGVPVDDLPLPKGGRDMGM